MGAGGAVGPNLHFAADDLASQCFAIRRRARSGSGQAEVERVDAQGFHAMKDLNFFFDGGIAHGR
jgi:hypothetical protein